MAHFFSFSLVLFTFDRPITIIRFLLGISSFLSILEARLHLRPSWIDGDNTEWISFSGEFVCVILAKPPFSFFAFLSLKNFLDYFTGNLRDQRLHRFCSLLRLPHRQPLLRLIFPFPFRFRFRYCFSFSSPSRMRIPPNIVVTRLVQFRFLCWLSPTRL
jgi:hypothetical protein